MRFGVCSGLENIAIVEAAGYDYIEIGFAGSLAPEKLEGDVLPALLERLKGAAIKPEAFNGMVPGDIKVTGPVIDRDRQNRYLTSAFTRAAAIGGKVVVFGSGGARQVPDSFSREEAYLQIEEFLQRAGDAAAAVGMVIAVEPLNVAECNILNSVAETVGVVDRVGHPAVQVLSDLYHVAHDSQSFDETSAAGSRLRHVHIASCPARKNPTEADTAMLTDYFRAVRRAGYDERVSIESGWTDFAGEAAATLSVIRAAWESSAAK